MQYLIFATLFFMASISLHLFAPIKIELTLKISKSSHAEISTHNKSQNETSEDKLSTDTHLINQANYIALLPAQISTPEIQTESSNETIFLPPAPIEIADRYQLKKLLKSDLQKLLLSLADYSQEEIADIKKMTKELLIATIEKRQLPKDQIQALISSKPRAKKNNK